MTISYHLAGGLSDPQLQQVRALAQRILREIGMEIDHDEIRAFLGQQRGVEVRGKRVCYDEALFEDCLTRQKSQNGDYVWQGPGDPDFAMRPAFYCLNVFDPLNSQVHRAGMADLVPAVRLCDSYDMVGTSPLHPQDVPEPIRQIATARACIANSRWVGKWMLAHNIDEIRCITEMSMLAGRTAPFVTLQMTISPMRLNVEYLDLLWRLRASPELLAAMTIGGGSIPMLGATGPLGLPAAWAQAVAEVVGAYITAKFIAPGVGAHASLQVFPFDLRSMAFIMGSPEGALSRLVGKQIQQHLFGRTLGATFGTMGLPLDPQSTAERMGNVLVEALAGARVFYDAGMASIDDTFCTEQLVLDHEIVLWVKRFISGLEYNADLDAAVEAIREGIADGTFLMHDWTLGHGQFYWRPELFTGEKLSTWLTGPRLSLASHARAIVEDRLREHQFSLPADVGKSIDRAYEKMAARLSG